MFSISQAARRPDRDNSHPSSLTSNDLLPILPTLTSWPYCRYFVCISEDDWPHVAVVLTAERIPLHLSKQLIYAHASISTCPSSTTYTQQVPSKHYKPGRTSVLRQCYSRREYVLHTFILVFFSLPTSYLASLSYPEAISIPRI